MQKRFYSDYYSEPSEKSTILKVLNLTKEQLSNISLEEAITHSL
jgi:DNA-directed RNA polymerase subunit H (RpoH/RPB5)